MLFRLLWHRASNLSKEGGWGRTDSACARALFLIYRKDSHMFMECLLMYFSRCSQPECTDGQEKECTETASPTDTSGESAGQRWLRTEEHRLARGPGLTPALPCLLTMSGTTVPLLTSSGTRHKCGVDMNTGKTAINI